MSEDNEERERTNSPAFYFCIAFVLIFLGFFGYTFFNASVYRIINGVDDCGNICGMENKKLSLPYCGSNDKRVDILTLVNITKDAINPNITHIHSKCVKRCEDFPGFKKVINRCYLIKGNGTNSTNGQEDVKEFTDVLSAVTEDLSNTWVSILITCVVALVFSYILLILFRYAIKYVIWVIYIGMIVLLLAGSVLMIVLYSMVTADGTKGDAGGFLIAAGALFLFAIIIGILLFFFRKRIRLVIQLFKEASKALSDVPMLVFEPVLTFLALTVTCIAFLYVNVITASSGTLKVRNDSSGNFKKALYVMDGAMAFTFVLNFLAVLWFTSFILGCQHFIVASTISQWFFTRSKEKLVSPVSRGFSLLLRFHIGSICLGSLLITLMKIIRMIVQGINSSMRNSENGFARCVAACCEYIIETLEEILQYLVRNAYIFVAKDGTPLFESGKKAFHLLTKNLMDVIALNKVGDFVLVLGRIFVALIAGFVGYEIISRNPNVTYPGVPVALCVIFAFLIVHCFMTIYEMTLDTIFICFCEDCEENDGDSRPYFMSSAMMKVMRELKEAAGGVFDFGHGQNVEAGPMIPQPHQQPYNHPDQPVYPQFDQKPFPNQPYPQQPPYPDQQPYSPQQPYPDQQPYSPQQPYPPQPYPQQPYPPQSYPSQPNQMPYPPQSYQHPTYPPQHNYNNQQ